MDSAAVTYKSQKIVKPSLLINLPMILCSVNLKMFVKGIPKLLTYTLVTRAGQIIKSSIIKDLQLMVVQTSFLYNPGTNSVGNPGDHLKSVIPHLTLP